MIDTLITYLQANCPSFTAITRAVSSEPIEELSSEAPALFVALGDEEASENELLNAVSQEVTVNVSLIMVCAIANTESLRAEIKTALLNYQISADYTPFTYIGAERLEIRGGYEWREFTYQTSEYFRS